MKEKGERDYILMRKELNKLFSAWREYIKDFLYGEFGKEIKKFLPSLGIGLGLGIVLLIWWWRSIVYAQGEEILKDISFISVKAFSWVVTGGFVSVVIGFARRNYRVFKRCFDLIVSGLGLIILSPLFLIISILVKIDSEGPIFFGQKRIGERGMIFKIWKFRTMRNNAELETGPVWAQAQDPRVTKIGLFLRKTHLDELPQLINVFRGEMSLIGPRPERPEFNEAISKNVSDFYRRLEVKPGITGLAQVRYRYSASVKDAARKLKYDLLYIKRMCFILDLRIIIWTLGRVLTGEGAR